MRGRRPTCVKNTDRGKNNVASPYMPPRRRHHKKHHTGRRRRHHKDRIYFDMLSPSAFLPSGRCSPLEGGGYRSRSSKTPRYKARHCYRKVRLGRDNRTLYMSVMRRRKIPYGRGSRLSYSWKVVYDRRTDKKFSIENLPPWVVTQIS